ncbi:MAG: dihydrofolate reductase family protein [Aurantibacter sp.]
MRKIVYYVAISLDGFIAGPEDDISGFVHQEELVHKYLNDLKGYDTVIMGRKTYELGYKFGLEPGQPAYPHMQHYLFSKTLHFENASDKIKVCNLDINIVEKLKEEEGTDIYLCGGAQFAGWLLKHQLIDVLRVKLNPFLLGKGIPLFSGVERQHTLKLKHDEAFPDGFFIKTYDIVY